MRSDDYKKESAKELDNDLHGSRGYALRSRSLYANPLPSSRTGAFYNAFSYPTKISPESIALFIASHTKPGDTVLDVFAGSGATGVAARLCDAPTESMIRQAEELGLEVKWGPRNAVLYEISVIGSLLADVMCNPPDPKEFCESAKRVLKESEADFAWLYEANDPAGEPGVIRYVIWSEVLVCPNCGERTTYWDAAVRLDPAAIGADYQCPRCKSVNHTASCRRVTQATACGSPEDRREQRLRVPVRVYGQTGSVKWQREANATDSELIEAVEARAIDDWYPSQNINWGDLHRTGYHQGIRRFCDLYTRRNLVAFARLWRGIESQPPHLKDALRVWALSFNASHSTIMTRVVAKTGQTDLVQTGAQSGVLYVSSLPVEKNVFEGLRRKIKVFAEAFALAFTSSSRVQVVNESSTRLALDDGSVEYVFTDPPFGGFIPYAELNQVNEAWLGKLTDASEEAIISPAQGKEVSDYQRLLTDVFCEVERVVAHSGLVTVVFHSSKPEVWAAVGKAFDRAGLAVKEASILDKTQPSFKQVVSSNGSRGDALMLLAPSRREQTAHAPRTGVLIDSVIRQACEGGQASELRVERLYSRYVGKCMKVGAQVEVGTAAFRAIVEPRISGSSDAD